MSRTAPWTFCPRCDSSDTQRDTENFYRCNACGCKYELVESKPWPIVREVKASND